MNSSVHSNTIYAAVVTDLDATIISWDPLLTEVWGYAAEEVIGKPFSFLFITAQKQEVNAFFVNNTQSSNTLQKTEKTALNKEGGSFETALNFSSLHNAENKLYSYVVHITVSAKNTVPKSEAILIETQKVELPGPYSDNNNKINKSTYCIWHWDLATNEVIRGDGFGDVFGYYHGNIIHNIKEWEELIHPNDLQRVKNKLQSVMKGDENNWTDEYHFRKANGAYTLVLDQGTIIRNEKGEAIQMIGAIHDLTREKYEEEQLRLFQSIIENVNDCIVVTEAEPINGDSPKVVYVNDAFTRMTGYSKAEVIGKTPRILQGPDSSRTELDKVRKALENWEPCEVEVLNYRKNGEPFWNNFSINPLANKDGWFTHWISVQREITHRKNAEENLKQKNHELQELSTYLHTVREDERRYIAREVHEEIGQLVSALKIDVDWLQIKFSPQDENTQKRLAHAVKTMEILISSVRKMASSLRPSILDDFGLNTALEWQCREWQNSYGIICDFKADFDDTNLSVKKATGLFRIGEESLKNAMIHSKADWIKVAVWVADDYLHLSVVDNGKGFDTAEKRNSFGLMSLRERALSMGGKLTINSQSGNGTTVMVSVPLQ